MSGLKFILSDVTSFLPYNLSGLIFWLIFILTPVYDFSAMYTTIFYNLLIKVFLEIIHFLFKSNVCSKIGFLATSIFWISKGLGKRYYTEKSLIESIMFLIKSCCFTIGKMMLKQYIGITMGIDPAPFWANLFIYLFDSKNVQNLISKKPTRAYKYRATSQFIPFCNKA